MKIYLNGEEIAFRGLTIEDLMDHLHIERNGCAIAVGTRVVPSAQWPEYRLAENDRITLIRATQGG